jgi:hypothetical protein
MVGQRSRHGVIMLPARRNRDKQKSLKRCQTENELRPALIVYGARRAISHPSTSQTAMSEWQEDARLMFRCRLWFGCSAWMRACMCCALQGVVACGRDSAQRV